LLECSGRRAASGTGGKDIINEQDGSAIQAGIKPGPEGLSHGVHAARGGLECQAIGSLDPAKGPTNSKIKGTGQAFGQGLGLVVTALHPPPPVQGDWYDPGVTWQLGKFALPGLCEQVAQPGGQPGIALVFQPQAEIAD
jgi:hypothetical protein